jgi:dihydroorotase
VRVFSDDGKCVSDPLLMRRALEYVKAFDGVIAQHSQEPRLTEGAQMNEGSVSAELGLAGWPAVAEESIIARDVLLAEHVGSRLHVCHLSTAGSVEIVRWAKARGINVTAEVTPHHLLLTDELARSYDAVYKVNPPLRTQADVLALREALIDGTIDIIATDHAPHPDESKDCEWNAAAFGMLGLEIAASVAHDVLIASGNSNWQRFAEVLSHNPSKIGRLAQQGQALEVGSIANLALIDPAQTRDAVSTQSKSHNNPYLGLKVGGEVVHTIYRGYFTKRDGKIASVGRNHASSAADSAAKVAN